MQIGILRKQLTLQGESLVADGSGGHAANWTTVATVWGDVKPTIGVDAVIVRNFDKRITHVITLRYRSDITTGMRLLDGSRILLIRGVVNLDEKNRWLQLLVEEGGLLG